MSTLYPRLYATLAGRVDSVLHYIAGDMLAANACDRTHTLHVAQALKDALLEAEETYLEAEEEL